MAVQTSTKPNVYEDEDDEPLVFKRCSTKSKPNQLNAEAKKIPAQRQVGQPGKQVSEHRSSNGLNSSVQKGKMVPSTKSPPVKSPLASPKASTSSAGASAVSNSKASTSSRASPVPKSPPSTTLDGHSKRLSEQNKSTTIKKEINSIEHPAQGNSDSEDEKPIGARLGKVKPSEDSDDDKPLSSRIAPKSKVGTSGSHPYDSKERKPVVSKVQKNGSSTTDKGKAPSVVSSKRPLDKANPSENSSAKRLKVSDSSTSVKNKPVAAKQEPKEEDDDDDFIPISQRSKKVASDSKSSLTKQTVTKVGSFSIKKTIKKSQKASKFTKYSKSTTKPPSSNDGQTKWTTLEHNGVIFPPPYKPHGIKMLYNGKPVTLTPEQEEVATMYAVMKDTDYVQKETFRKNFWADWHKLLGKNHVIQKLDACDFTPIYDWYQNEKEKKKQMSTEEKKALKEEKLKQEEKYMWARVDGNQEKVGNFRVEPPGLFRGRGEHPKSGKLKRRICPSDVTINIGKNAPIPECPIPGESWKEVRHDNTVTWLAFWNDPINPREFKYVFLAPSSNLKGLSDMQKYEKARRLKDHIGKIRASYTKDFTSKDVTKRQIAVATYLIDKLALRAGNEKDDDEADTVGCCTLKVENVKAIPPNSLEFNFLGKDSIRYENTVEVETPVYKAIIQFQSGKRGSDDLFDMLDTSRLNAHLKNVMDGLTAKVFRTYNASITLDDILNKKTKDGDLSEKLVVYQHANKEVAIICNHQRTVSKTHSAQMSKLTEKIDDLQGIVKDLKIDLDRAKKGKPPLKDADGKQKKNLTPEALERKIAQTNAKIEKMELDMRTKEDLKTVALGTSKINYLDPRITVAWCKRHEVPIEKIFNKSLLAKFSWAMPVEPDFRF
ncbi:hypothetical protein FF1_012449 [Malus domestica]|uniref:DNA topoisomerase I n=3 Tax=Malus domestica TaxID=3750 RepID=A0A498IGD2_MALDO|nr:hypothetical protein DVH24_041460 [Malus domestica]